MYRDRRWMNTRTKSGASYSVRCPNAANADADASDANLPGGRCAGQEAR